MNMRRFDLLDPSLAEGPEWKWAAVAFSRSILAVCTIAATAEQQCEVLDECGLF